MYTLKNLDSRDRDGAIKDALSKGEAMAHVTLEEVALDLAALGDAQHVARDIDAHPLVPQRFQGLPTQPGAAADVEDIARRAIVWSIELHAEIWGAWECGMWGSMGAYI